MNDQNTQKNVWEKFKEWGTRSFGKKVVFAVIKTLLYTFVVLVFVAAGSAVYFYIIGGGYDKSSTMRDGIVESGDVCNVAGITLHGTIITYATVKVNETTTALDGDVTSSANVVDQIKKADADPSVLGIIVEVDSGGGSPEASEEIANELALVKKPKVAFIRQTGASGAYWSITTADRIFGSKNSDIGSIGVTGSYLNNVEKNKKEGYALEELSIGKYKEVGNPDRALTDDEKALILRDSKIVYENFIDAVSKNRHIPIEKVRTFADGSTVLGEQAKALGLIDEIGGLTEATNYLSKQINEDPEICWY